MFSYCVCVRICGGMRKVCHWFVIGFVTSLSLDYVKHLRFHFLKFLNGSNSELIMHIHIRVNNVERKRDWKFNSTDSLGYFAIINLFLLHKMLHTLCWNLATFLSIYLMHLDYPLYVLIFLWEMAKWIYCTNFLITIFIL